MLARGNAVRILLLTLLAGAIVWMGLHRAQWSAANLEAQLRSLGFWAPAAFVALYALATVLFFPGSILTLAGGGLFGPLWGTLWNLTGATIGAGLAFLIARYAAADWVRNKTGERLKRMIEGVEGEDWRFVAFVRLVPLFPFNLLNYALGLTRIRFGEYLLTSAICMAPGAIAYTWLGYAGRQAAAGNASAVRSGLLAIGLIAAVAFLPRLIARLRGRLEFIDASTLRQRLDLDPAIAVIDVRRPEEFDGPLGHIHGARNIVLAELPAKMASLAAMKSASVVTVCATDRRSAKAARLLKGAGFRQVQVLRAGMQGWKQGGFPVERVG
ncbi:MAG TPA: VTT domain-containing protein [Candidatus Binataceae bacterium]|nr:VTT domain-containing protein [Candidatus Binataceae bacterium]